MQAQGLVVNPQWPSPELTHYTVSDLSDSHSKLGYHNQLVAHATQFHRRNTTPANESYLFSGHPPGSRTQPRGQAGIMHGHKSWSCLGHLVTPGRGTVGEDWRAPWDLVHTCSILLQWHYRLSWSHPTRKLWGRCSSAQGYLRHKADPEQGSHLLGSKSYNVSEFSFPLKNSISDH